MPKFALVWPRHKKPLEVTGECCICGVHVNWIDLVDGVVLVSLEARPVAVVRNLDGDCVVLARKLMPQDGLILWP